MQPSRTAKRSGCGPRSRTVFAAGAAAKPVAVGPGESLELEHFFPYRLSVLSNRVSRSIARLYSERFGISIPEWRVMAVLGRFAPLTANEITERTAMDKVAVSRAAGRLVARRFIERRLDPSDRRRALLKLSRQGRRIYREIVPLAQDAEAKLLAALSASERDQINRLLKKLEGRIAAQM